MTIAQSGIHDPVSAEKAAPGRLPGTGEVLRLLGAGATGSILLALGRGPLRTKELTKQVPGFAPRTIYRYAGKLADIGVVEREEEPGVPSKVVHRLTDPSGAELHRVVAAYAEASLERLPSGDVGVHSWGSLAMVADLWESGMVEELNLGPRTATELARGQRFLSYHQVSRRAVLFETGGLIAEWPGAGRRRRYELTANARRAMALVAGIARWRRHHEVEAGEAELSPAETACLLRTTLPLLRLPGHGGKTLGIEVLSADGERGEFEPVTATVGADGTLVVSEMSGSAQGWGSGQPVAWLDTLVDGTPGLLQIGGDSALVEDCVAGLHRTLWKSPAPGD